GGGGGFVGAMGVDVAEGEDLGVGLMEDALKEEGSAIADADHASADGLFGLVGAGSHGGAQQENAAIDSHAKQSTAAVNATFDQDGTLWVEQLAWNAAATGERFLKEPGSPD